MVKPPITHLDIIRVEALISMHLCANNARVDCPTVQSSTMADFSDYERLIARYIYKN